MTANLSRLDLLSRLDQAIGLRDHYRHYRKAVRPEVRRLRRMLSKVDR